MDNAFSVGEIKGEVFSFINNFFKINGKFIDGLTKEEASKKLKKSY